LNHEPDIRPEDPDPKATAAANEALADWRSQVRAQMRLRRLVRLPLVSPRLWLRRIVFWCGALVIGLAAIAFARLATGAVNLFYDIIGASARTIGIGYPLMFLLSPAGLLLAVWMTRNVFPGAQGSGIPQVIAAIRMWNPDLVNQVLSARIAVGKVVITLLGLACGASIGREGPTVQVGASIMFALGKVLRLPNLELQRSLVLAGGAAGLSGAFNTPLAGVVFAIEELAHGFEARSSGMVLSAVVMAGITTLAIVGNYTYFGISSATLEIGRAWAAVLVCGVIGGLCGGVFSYVLTIISQGRPRVIGRFVMRHPFGFAACCGLAIALLGWASGGSTAGTGYNEARGILMGSEHFSGAFPFLKLLANVASYISGIPGGIFSPSLAVGAGLGGWLSNLLPRVDPAAMVLLGMVAYFSGVVQAPITAAVIVMEMTDNQSMAIPLLATSILAFGVSQFIARRPLYSALADRFVSALEQRPEQPPVPAEPGPAPRP
jgi:H+/Cl- antiporter ClcA